MPRIQGVPHKEVTASGLNLLAQCQARFSRHFQPKFREARAPDDLRDEIACACGNLKARTKAFLEDTGRLRTALQEIEGKIAEKSKDNTDSVVSALQKLSSVGVDPCLRYISALRLDQLLQRATTDFQVLQKEIDCAMERISESRHALIHDKEGRKSFMRQIGRALHGSLNKS